MKHISKIVFLFSFAGFVYSGCASSTTPPPPSTTKVNYVTNAYYTYAQYRRDTAGGTYGMDKIVPTPPDIITSAVIATNSSYQNQSGNVTVIQNTHSLTGVEVDTTYIAQSNGSFLHYNYGLEALNNNSYVQNKVGRLDVGWVLQAKFGANPGDTWIAADTIIPIQSLSASIMVRIDAVEQADTTIMVQGTSIAVKHVLHTVTITPPIGKITGTIDTYVSATDGVVENIVHSNAVSIPLLITTQVSGTETMMVSHP